MNYLIPSPKEQLLNELCKNGRVEDHRETIRAMLAEINRNGARVACKYNETASNLDPSLDERPELIRVSLVGVKNRLDILWGILHEYGHYLDWPRKPEDSVITREETAWRIAEQQLQQYPQLVPEIAGFRQYRNWCLNSYYRYYGVPEITDETRPGF
jgi:hypothetical protein